ncbi:MAG: DUF4338 domain-containing protein [Acidobacteria bacterium]|nr:DUF4338 domain-containing protein [Acidobacteriota bacterium]
MPLGQPNGAPLSFAGREFSSADLELIRHLTSDLASLGITEIARTACELLEWKRPSGGLKNLECRRLIEQLAGRGLLQLPARRGAGAPGPRRAPRTAGGEWQAEVHGSAGEFEPLRLEVVRGGPADSRGSHGLFKELLDRYHYLGYRVPFGASLRYLVRSGRAPDPVLACLLWSSPAWKMAARDGWIGWSDQQRARNLPFIVNHSRFLILPWVRVKGLASKVLATCARQLPRDWEQLYGYRPLLLETLVDRERFRGTCYRAANWIHLGQTSGRGRMDREHAAHGAAVKDLYVYPLCRDVAERLRSAAAPVWKQAEGDASRP